MVLDLADFIKQQVHEILKGPISQRDLRPDFDLNLRLWSFLGRLYDVTRFSISQQHLSLDKMHQMKNIKGHMTEKTTVVI